MVNALDLSNVAEQGTHAPGLAESLSLLLLLLRHIFVSLTHHACPQRKYSAIPTFKLVLSVRVAKQRTEDRA